MVWPGLEVRCGAQRSMMQGDVTAQLWGLRISTAPLPHARRWGHDPKIPSLTGSGDRCKKPSWHFFRLWGHHCLLLITLSIAPLWALGSDLTCHECISPESPSAAVSAAHLSPVKPQRSCYYCQQGHFLSQPSLPEVAWTWCLSEPTPDSPNVTATERP